MYRLCWLARPTHCVPPGGSERLCMDESPDSESASFDGIGVNLVPADHTPGHARFNGKFLAGVRREPGLRHSLHRMTLC